MFVEALEGLKKNPFAIKIKGKGLLYGVDLLGNIQNQTEHLVFRAEGNLRFGVLSSPGIFYSKYRVTESSVGFVEHSIEFPRIGFLERYRLENNQVMFIKNKQNERLIEGLVDPLIDPLPLVYQLLAFREDESMSYNGPLLVGGQQKKMSFVKTDQRVQVQLNSKPLFEGEWKGSILHLVIPQFKVKLEVSRV